MPELQRFLDQHLTGGLLCRGKRKGEMSIAIHATYSQLLAVKIVGMTSVSIEGRLAQTPWRRSCTRKNSYRRFWNSHGMTRTNFALQ